MARKTDKQKAQELIDEVEHLFDRAQTPKAKKAWAKNTLPKIDKVIKLDPDNIGTWLVRGLVNSELGDHKGAIDNYDKAIELDPEDSRAWFQRGVAKIHLKDMGGYDDMRKAEKLHSPEPPKPKPTLADGFESAFGNFFLGLAMIFCFIGIVCVGQLLLG